MIISKTPFRISFAGGGSDLAAFYEKDYGAVVSTAIDKFIYIAIHRFFERKFVLKYSNTETCETIDEIRHPLIRECLRITNTNVHMEVTSFADIPSTGSGLGSSSAFAVGLINALTSHQGRPPSAETCARQACTVEIDRLHEPIGMQDQYAAAYGGMNYIRFSSDGSVQVDPIVMPAGARAEIERHLVLFYTGITRKASTILAEQKKNISDATRFDVLRRMRDQADYLRAELGAGNIAALGTLMHEGWELKKQMASGVSSSNLDEIYTRALGAGAIGGKLLGAGGGGFFLFYCEPEKRAGLVQALSDLRPVDFRLERQGTRIIYVGDE